MTKTETYVDFDVAHLWFTEQFKLNWFETGKWKTRIRSDTDADADTDTSQN